MGEMNGIDSFQLNVSVARMASAPLLSSFTLLRSRMGWLSRRCPSRRVSVFFHFSIETLMNQFLSITYERNWLVSEPAVAHSSNGFIEKWEEWSELSRNLKFFEFQWRLPQPQPKPAALAAWMEAAPSIISNNQPIHSTPHFWFGVEWRLDWFCFDWWNVL